MSGFDDASRDIKRAYESPEDMARFYLMRAIASALIGIGERLESIDDALRNTIGGQSR